MTDPLEDVKYSTEEIAGILDIGAEQVRVKLRSGQFPGAYHPQNSRSWIIPRSALETYLGNLHGPKEGHSDL